MTNPIINYIASTVVTCIILAYCFHVASKYKKDKKNI